jgi:hypothetical protein
VIKQRIAIIIAMVVSTTVAFCVNSYRAAYAPTLSPSVIIYKMKSDYSKYVPVTLSEDKSKVVSYPDPKDVYYNGQLAYPTQLIKGFWLDNRGIGPNSAFIRLTYEEYAKLPTAPTPDELYAMIGDKDPFTRIYNLGNRYTYKDAVTEINHLIKKHELDKFKRIK